MRTLFVLLFCAATLSANAQETQKIGYADWNSIFGQMPEYKQIENELKTHGTQLENQLKAKTTEFETKLRAYQSMPATTPDAIKADKERELQALQESIQKFQQDAQNSLENKRQALMDPVFKKVGKAIEDTAKENGYSFIINPQSMSTGEDIVLYSDDKYNISNLVLKKLGVTPKPEATKPN
ncbi:MAG: OmpH family outer membrane protein [Cytophagales bacterium]|nr:OmpH family outer membrane protein [Cytophagales bacterium]